jgi:glycosyltransferase XagB
MLKQIKRKLQLYFYPKVKNDFNEARFFRAPMAIRLALFLIVIFIVHKNIKFCLFFAVIPVICISVLQILQLIFRINGFEDIIDQNIANFKDINSIDQAIEMMNLKKSELKSYAILLPLLRENEVIIASLFDSMSKILYPKNLFDIFVLCEYEDQETINIVKEYIDKNLGNFRLIIVPPKSPLKTKGRALNYAMKFVKSHYVCIFDAEDQPDKIQLLYAHKMFIDSQRNPSRWSKKLGVVQAVLENFNRRSYISELMHIEYRYIFSVRNFFMQKLCGWFPLGGTSNHFLTEAVRSVGGWNSYNLTEDADISVKLNMSGWGIDVMPIITKEEAVENVDDFIGQRSRWMKGFLQLMMFSFCSVFCKKFIIVDRLKMMAIFFYFFSLQGVFAFIVFSVEICYYIFESFNLSGGFDIFSGSQNPSLLMDLTILNILLKFLYYSLLVLMGKNDGKFLIKRSQIFMLIISFWLIMVSYFKCIYEIIFKPYFWEKTNHFGDKINR